MLCSYTTRSHCSRYFSFRRRVFVGQAFSLRRILIRPELDANSISSVSTTAPPAMAGLSRFLTCGSAGASTYKLPSWSEMPEDFRVSFLERAADPGVIFGSKAVDQLPLMLANFGTGGPVDLASPATPERVFFAIPKAKAGLEKSHEPTAVALPK
jgi:hypothetical protein